MATLGKSGVSVGYYDTEEAAARAYDRAAIGLLGRDSAGISTNFALADYDAEAVPQLIGKTREEVKATLKSERAKARPRAGPGLSATEHLLQMMQQAQLHNVQGRVECEQKPTNNITNKVGDDRDHNHRQCA